MRFKTPKYLLNLKLWGIKYEFQEIISNNCRRWMKKEHVFYVISLSLLQLLLTLHFLNIIKIINLAFFLKKLFSNVFMSFDGLTHFFNFFSRSKEETELEVNLNRYVFLTDQFIWAACYSVSWCIYAITPAFLFSTALFHFHIYFLISVYFLRPRMINVVCTGQSQIYKLWPTVCQVYDIKLVSTDLCLKCLGDSIVSLTNDNI